MQSRFHEAANEELLADVKTATAYIEHHPQSAPIIEDGCARRFVRRFPYSLFYVVEPQDLFIVAVAHHSRRPAYWADRL